MPAPVQDSVLPFVHEELHLVGHRCPTRLMEVKVSQFTLIFCGPGQNPLQKYVVFLDLRFLYFLFLFKDTKIWFLNNIEASIYGLHVQIWRWMVPVIP